MEINIDNCNGTKDINIEEKLQSFSELNEQLREYVEHSEKSIRLPRKVTNIINDMIFRKLKEYVFINAPEGGFCYYVKNITPSNNTCFVHKFTDTQKSFQNIELSSLPSNVSKGDVIVIKDGKYVVDTEITNSVLNIRKQIIDSQKNSIGLFQIDGKEYMVCDKSDEATPPMMSLRTIDTMQEYWGIEIDSAFYDNIQYGSTVVYQNGEYVLKN